MSIERQPEAMAKDQGPSTAEILAELLHERQQSDRGLRELIRQVLAEYLAELQQSSCAMGRNASGATTIEMKEYAPTVRDAYATVKPVFKLACEEHPYSKAK